MWSAATIQQLDQPSLMFQRYPSERSTRALPLFQRAKHSCRLGGHLYITGSCNFLDHLILNRRPIRAHPRKSAVNL
jgi:hypothetical protein